MVTPQQQVVVDFLAAHPGRCFTPRETLEVGGHKPDPREVDARRRILFRLAAKGAVSKTGDGKYAAGTAVAAAPSKSTATDPWGNEYSEVDARQVISDALKYYFGRKALRENPSRLARESFLAGAFMSGRPLPQPTVQVAPVASPVAPAGPTAPPSAALPSGWTTDTLAKKLGAAVKRGAVTYQALADQTGLAEDHLRRYG